MDIDGTTPVAQDYLKTIWSATEWGGQPLGTAALAERFGTSRANVSDVANRLAEQGLVLRRPYKPLELTDRGRAVAVAMVRRHRLIETFLLEVLGYGWDEVHDEAERLEHAASDTMIARIDALLGHPAADPHGDPIPGPDGRPRARGGARALAEGVEAGEYDVVRVSDEEPDVLRRAGELGLAPGAPLRAGDDGALEAPGGEVPAAVAAALWVRARPTRDGGL